MNAKIRALEILQNMGCDLRVLQMEGAKDPDEYVLKYGNARFNNLVEKALSIIEFKVKILKQKLDLNNINDKIKFLNQTAKILSETDNAIEREIYVERIAQEYGITKEAIYAEINKLSMKENNQISDKILNRNKATIINRQKESMKKISEAVLKKENTIISILLNGDINIFQIIRQNIKVEDFKDEINQHIAKKIYAEYEKENNNFNQIIDEMEIEEQSRITEIMAEDYEIDDIEKAIDDIIQSYEKEKINERKFEILELLESSEGEHKKELEKELSDIIVRLAKIK